MTSITTMLTVSSSGKYTANPESVSVIKSNTELVYTLDRESAINWQIMGLSTTDQKGQAGPYTIAPGGNSISFVDANTSSDTFNVYINIIHRATQVKHWIDPQVTNIPPV